MVQNNSPRLPFTLVCNVVVSPLAVYLDFRLLHEGEERQQLKVAGHQAGTAGQCTVTHSNVW